ncbi:MAG TPA: ornithine cyclodeaminase family protein [Bryobacteraceae bacterium]|nr:ornithine cyclodeaminase family protein [Bryobacteraceae bacterium]
MVRFNEEQVRRLLSMPECIEALRSAFRAWAAGEALNQPRRRMRINTGSVLHSMAGAYGAYFGTKIYSTHARHGANFFFLLFDSATARPLAEFEANHLGQIRTGAATGLAVDVLAHRDVATVAVIGSGFQARTQVEAIRAVRSIRAVRVWSRTAEKRTRFAEEVGGENCASARQAIEDADVVITATSSRDPVLEAAWVPPGALVCAVGSNDPQRRELPGELIRHAGAVVADDIEQCRIEAGDLLLALDEAGWARVTALADYVAGNTKPGDSRRVTVFKSVGLGLEDVAAAAAVYEKATPGPPSADRSPATR